VLAREYDWSAEVAKVEAPTMLVYGDADAIPPRTLSLRAR
jgi:pimeloyl-ACP methyl ester carboxylesterase